MRAEALALFVLGCGASSHVIDEPFVELLESTPTLSPGALHVSMRAILPRAERADRCTLRLTWRGRGHGESDAIAPSAVDAESDVVFDTVVALPADEDLVEVEGVITCPTRTRRVLPRRIGTDATLVRYCGACSGLERPPPTIDGGVDGTELDIGVYAGIAPRVREGRLIDACDDRVLIDLASIGADLVADDDRAAEIERSMLFDHEHGVGVCDRRVSAGVARIPPAALAEVLADLRATPGIASVEPIVEPY